MKLSELIDSFIAEKRGYLLPSSLRKHEITKRDILSRIMDVDVAVIRAQEATNYRSALVVAANARCGMNTVARYRAESTIARHCRNAKGYFDYAIRLGLIEKNPFQHVRTSCPAMQLPRRVMSAKEITTITAFARPEIEMLVALCFYAGLRKSEAIRLKMEHVDFARNRILVYPPNGRVSSKHRYREVLLVPALAKLIQDKCMDRVSVVGKILEPKAWTYLHDAAKAAGVSTTGLNFQVMRSSRENHWLADGIPANVVMSWLGHTAAVSVRHYNAVPEQFYASGKSKDEQIADLIMELEIMKNNSRPPIDKPMDESSFIGATTPPAQGA